MKKVQSPGCFSHLSGESSDIWVRVRDWIYNALESSALFTYCSFLWLFSGT